jgi:cobalt-zinc-cadmium efflux system outer membrane protein
MRRYTVTVTFSVLFVLIVSGQTTKRNSVSLTEYLSKVNKGNLGYLAEQFNVSIAVAQLKAARVFADPELSVAYTNNEDKTMMMGQGINVGVTYPISLGNKRGAIIALAQSQKELAQSALDACFENLRVDATIRYFTAIRQMQILKLQTDIYDRLSKLAQADEVRQNAGLISATDALQTALEARAQQNTLYQAEADFQSSLVQLAQLQGNIVADSLLVPTSQFPLQQREFKLSELVQSALARRSDLQIAIRTKVISENQVRLIKANRAFEFAVDAGFSHSTLVNNEIAPAPAFNSYEIGLTIPLKFSAFNRGELESARNAAAQSEIILKEVQLQIAGEVNQAWLVYKSAERQLNHYRSGIVGDADKIVKARAFSYQKGETGLIDLLNAQRTYHELQLGYHETLYKYAESLVLLEKAAGIWDIE